MYVGTGYWIIIVLFLWMIIEIVFLLVINLDLALSRYAKGEDITPESRIYTSRALTLGGLTFAAIALLLGSYSDNINYISNTLIVLVYTLGLLLCSFRMEVLTNYRRIYWLLQEKLLNFGYMGLMFSLVTFFIERIAGVTIIAIIFLIVIAIIHTIEYASDYRYFSRRRIT